MHKLFQVSYPAPASNLVRVDMRRLLMYVQNTSIYAYYYKEPITLNKAIVSPLRVDRSPSFSFYMSEGEHIFWIDFGFDYGVPRDCVGFVQALPYKEKGYCWTRDYAIQKIWSEMVLQGGVATLPEINPQIPIKLGAAKNLDTVTTPTSGPLRPFELDYWMKLKVDVDSLALYQTYSLRRLVKNNKDLTRLNENGVHVKWDSTPEHPTFLYDFEGIPRAFQLYRPNHVAKFYSKLFTSVLFGYKQLPPSGDTLFITKAMKDIIVLHSHGFWAVAPSSENAVNLLLEKLPELFSRFKRVIYIPDNDPPGLQAAYRLSTRIQEAYPQLSFNMCIIFPIEAKDPSGYVSNGGDLKQYMEEAMASRHPYFQV